MSRQRRVKRFGNGRMNGVLRGLGQDFDDLSPGGTTVGVDTIPLDGVDDAGAAFGDSPGYGVIDDAAAAFGNGEGSATVPVIGTPQVASVYDSLPLPSLNTDMLNKLIAVGGQVYKMVQENGKVVPRATGQTISTSAPQSLLGNISGKQVMIGLALAYLLLG